MPETKKTKKRGMEDPAKKAEAAKKTRSLKGNNTGPDRGGKRGRSAEEGRSP